MRKFIVASVALLTIASCSTPDNRYSSASGLDLGTPQALDLDVSSIPAPSVAAATASSSSGNLAERAEAAYITALGSKLRDAAAFQAAVAKPIADGDASGTTDRSSLSRIMVITVSQKGYYPADRLVFMRISITPDETFSFSGLTAAATNWASQSIDTMDVSNDVKFSPELDATLAGSVKGTLKNTVAFDHSTDVKANITEPYEQLAANLDSKGDLVIVGTGARGVNLLGTSLAKLNLVPPSGQDPNTLTIVDADNFTVMSGAKWLSPSQAKLSVKLVTGLKPVYYTAKADLIYTIRHVTGPGLQSYREDDDDVQYLTVHETCDNLILATPQDTGLATWSIYADNNSDQLKIGTPEGSMPAVFTSFDAAERFAAWLGNEYPTHIAGWPLTLVPWKNSSLSLPIRRGMTFSVLPTEYPRSEAPAAESCQSNAIKY